MISVCTAIHPPAVRYLPELYNSLFNQDRIDWEWVIATDGGAVVQDAITADSRVRVIESNAGQAKAKAAACEASRGEWIVRVDGDDVLMPGALDRLAECPNECGFLWGNWAVFVDGSWMPKRYDSKFGWRYRSVWYGWFELWEHLAWPIGPLMIASLYMSPACFLAWRRQAYFDTGGFGNEPQDSPEHGVVCRTYLNLGQRGMHHIDDCLYLYRQHDSNMSTKVLGKAAMRVHAATYREYIEHCCRRWCVDEGLREIQVGDSEHTVAAGDDSVGMLRTANESLAWEELWRIMAPGGMVLVDCQTSEEDPRFQRCYQSNMGTHFACLKPPYSDRRVG